VGAVTNRPAASWNDHPSGTGSRALSGTASLVAKAPWLAPKTRLPTGKRGELELAGTETTTPENSEPATHGKAARGEKRLRSKAIRMTRAMSANSRGWFWYLPWIWRMSKKLAAAPWTCTTYSFGLGNGSGSSVTLSSLGLWALVSCVFIHVVRKHADLDIFSNLDPTHAGRNGRISLWKRRAGMGYLADEQLSRRIQVEWVKRKETDLDCHK
jgi:hypothetical protein